MLDGGALELTVEGEVTRLLAPGGPACQFPGDRPTFAQLVDEGEPCRAFNVLTRLDAFVSRVRDFVVDGTEVLEPEGGTLVGVLRSGELVVENETGLARLGPLDAFVASESVNVGSIDGATLLLVRLIRT